MSNEEPQVAVVIDETRCVGVGYCVKAEPEAIEMLDEGYSRPIPGYRLPLSRADSIVGRCPSRAIRIESD